MSLFRKKEIISEERKDYDKRLELDEKRKKEAEEKSELILNKIIQNPFIDEIVKNIINCMETRTSTFEREYIVDTYYDHIGNLYYNDYNLPTVDLSEQLAIAKATKIKLKEKHYDCIIRERREDDIRPLNSSDAIPLKALRGYILVIKKEENKVTKAWY